MKGGYERTIAKLATRVRINVMKYDGMISNLEPLPPLSNAAEDVIAVFIWFVLGKPDMLKLITFLII